MLVSGGPHLTTLQRRGLTVLTRRSLLDAIATPKQAAIPERYAVGALLSESALEPVGDDLDGGHRPQQLAP